LNRSKRAQLLSALSLLALAATLILCDATWDNLAYRDLSSSGFLWELTVGSGRLALSNDPEASRSISQDYHAIQVVRHTFSEAEAALHREIDVAPYGSPEYQQLVSLVSGARMASEFSQARILHSGGKPPWRHSLSLWIVALLFSIRPLIWLMRWLIGHRLIRHEVFHIRAVVPMLLLAVAAVILVGGIRSYFVGTTWQSATAPAFGGLPEPPMPSGFGKRVPVTWCATCWLVCADGKFELFQSGMFFPENRVPFGGSGVSRGGELDTLGGGNRLAKPVTMLQLPGIAHFRAVDLASWVNPPVPVAIHQASIVSMGYPLAASLVIPALWLRGARRRILRQRRRANNQCAECGYSMQGIPTGMCPECGTASGKPARAAAKI